MRKYAVLTDTAEGNCSIIFQDESESKEEWFIFEKYVHGGNAPMIVAALNAAEQSEARRTI